ncbi:MAG: hypothetical protein HY293_11255 [Planctomycetes bacterium]|nr:hypothetical protein [Planctomycetota bacterium]
MMTEILCLGLALSAQDPGTPEMRGGWLSADTFDTPAQRTDIVAKFRRGHLNTIFLTVPPLNGNYGTSDPAAFGALIADAKAAGLNVYAWFQNFKRQGESTPADFTSAGERDLQKQWVLAMLAAYPALDGVHLDYIRYSTWEACNAAKINGVAETVRTIHEALKSVHPGMPLTAAIFNAAAITYRGWKPTWEGDVPPWYRDWYAADSNNYYVRRANEPGNNANWLLGPSFFSYQQDPPAWLKAGHLDAVCSMQYTSVDATWRNEADLWKSFLAFQGVGADRAFIGLGWMAPVPFFEDSNFDAPALVRFIKHGRSLGLKGFSIFRLGQPGVDDSILLDALSVDGPANGNGAPFKVDVASTLGGSAPPPPVVPPPAGGPAPKKAGGGGSGCGLTGLEVLVVLAALRRR